MLKIRLKRVGRRNRPSFRIMVVDSRQGPKSGRFVEQVGFYNPITKDKDIKGDRVKYWIEHGAQPSDTVFNMLVAAGIIDGKKKNVLPQKSPVIKENEESGESNVENTEASADTETSDEAQPEAAEETSAEEAKPTEEEKPTEETPAEESKEEAPAEEETKEE